MTVAVSVAFWVAIAWAGSLTCPIHLRTMCIGLVGWPELVTTAVLVQIVVGLVLTDG